MELRRRVLSKSTGGNKTSMQSRRGSVTRGIGPRVPRTPKGIGLVVATLAALVASNVVQSSGATVSSKLQAQSNVGNFSNVPATPIQIGASATVDTEAEAAFVFDGVPGQRIAIRSNRPWSLTDPTNRVISGTQRGTIPLQYSGKYLINVEPSIRPPAQVTISRVDAAAITKTVRVGEDITLDSAELRDQLTRIQLKGGQRYRMVVLKDQPGATFCAEDWSQIASERICLTGGYLETSQSFVLERDTEFVVTGLPPLDEDQEPEIPTIRARLEVAPNDIVVDTSKSPVVAATAKPGQSIVIPFWGSPAERAVLSSPVESQISAWGQPWIDREGTGADRAKAFAVPVRFDPVRPPYVSWSGSVPADSTANTRRFGVYRGEDTPVNVPTTGDPVLVTNRPWFAAVGSFSFEEGERYVVQLSGKGIRPLSLALRDPSGKFTSNINPWQWTETDGIQRAQTIVSVDRGGKWALEVRPAGNNVRELAFSAAKAGGNSRFEGSIDVEDVLTVGEATDVQLGPNEFARMTVKLAAPSPQIIQPVVLRYRNNTFQPTAVDLSLWDTKGRMVWSNNRNLEEEVLSGRLGREPELSEQFATVTSAEPYTLVVDPHSDLAGRFRVSVVSTPVTSDVKLSDGPVPLLLGGTKTGVVEVLEPTRFRVKGVSACLTATSLTEWGGGNGPVGINQAPVDVRTVTTTIAPSAFPVAPQPIGPRCVQDGRSITLPPGVHRITFQDEVKKGTSFTKVAPGAAPDPLRFLDAKLDGEEVSIPNGYGPVFVRVNVAKVGTHVVFETRYPGSRDFNSALGWILAPDGNRMTTYGRFVAELPGTYTFVTFGNELGSMRARTGLDKPQTTSLAIGAKSKIFNLVPEQLLEASVIVSKRTRIAMEVFPDDVSFLYAADVKERRFSGSTSGGIVLEPGKYRFVFQGEGEVRIKLMKSALVGY